MEWKFDNDSKEKKSQELFKIKALKKNVPHRTGLKLAIKFAILLKKIDSIN